MGCKVKNLFVLGRRDLGAYDTVDVFMLIFEGLLNAT